MNDFHLSLSNGNLLHKKEVHFSTKNFPKYQLIISV